MVVLICQINLQELQIHPHIKPTAPKLSTTWFGRKTYRPITPSNIGNPVKSTLFQKRQLILSNGKNLETSTSRVPVTNVEYNGMSHYLGGPATTQVITYEDV